MLVVALLARSKSRIALSFYVGANLISITLWASSLTILDQGIHRVLWYLGILTEVLVNVISRGDKTLSWAASNLAERLGLLTLIVLGKSYYMWARHALDDGGPNRSTHRRKLDGVSWISRRIGTGHYDHVSIWKLPRGAMLFITFMQGTQLDGCSHYFWILFHVL